MATTFTKLISLMAYDNALTERTDDYYLRAKTQPQTLGIAEIARETAALLGKYGEDEIALILNKAEEVKCEATASGYIISTTKASARHAGPYPYKGRYTYPQREIHII